MDVNLTSLADEVAEYTKMKYIGDCKCGQCQLVPIEFVERLAISLKSAAAEHDRLVDDIRAARG